MQQCNYYENYQAITALHCYEMTYTDRAIPYDARSVLHNEYQSGLSKYSLSKIMSIVNENSFVKL